MVTTQIKGPEAVEHAVAATLRAKLNGELAATWAAWATFDTADGVSVPLVYPAQIIAGRQGIASDYPTIMVASDLGIQRTNAAPNWGEVDHTLAVIVWLVADDVLLLHKMMHRYLTSIWEVLMKNQSMDGTIALTGIDPGEYGRAVPVKLGETAGIVHVGGWTFIAHVEQGTSQG